VAPHHGRGWDLCRRAEVMGDEAPTAPLPKPHHATTPVAITVVVVRGVRVGVPSSAHNCRTCRTPGLLGDC